MRTKDDHLTELYGLPAFTFPEERDAAGVVLPEADAVAWRIGYDRWTTGERWKNTSLVRAWPVCGVSSVKRRPVTGSLPWLRWARGWSGGGAEACTAACRAFQVQWRSVRGRGRNGW
ncbi:hypothetical protein [Streptomyces sp. NPDC002553]|uniref:hypothetical protein n=1 Tax=Streptomyces sp. NPDC002553 TaxID=3154417 RepID=UPI003325CAE4